MNFMQRISASLFRPWQAVTKQDLKTTEENIMAKVSTLGATLSAIKAQQEKADAEIRTKLDEQKKAIENLTNQLGDIDIPADAQAALEALQASTQALDDIVPDAVPAQG